MNDEENAEAEALVEEFDELNSVMARRLPYYALQNLAAGAAGLEFRPVSKLTLRHRSQTTPEFQAIFEPTIPLFC